MSDTRNEQIQGVVHELEAQVAYFQSKLSEAEKEKADVWAEFRQLQANWQAVSNNNLELINKISTAQEQAFRAGYEAGAMAVHAIGDMGFYNCDKHFSKWLLEAMQ